MKFLTAQQLDEYRIKLNKEKPSVDGTTICLFGVYESLDRPVNKFIKITKRYIYDINGIKHRYLTNGLTLFSNNNEAWKYFLNKLQERKQRFKKYCEIEKESIDIGTKIIKGKIQNNPELFF